MKIQILCGPIASGKSTYAKFAAKNNVICVNDDAIVNMLHANDYTLYDESLKPLYKSIENHIIATAITMNKSVLIDRALNGTIQGRQRFIALAKSFDCDCDIVVFENSGSKIHAERRANSDSRGHSLEYWLKVAERHNALYTAPSFEEGFNYIHHITFDEIRQGKIIF